MESLDRKSEKMKLLHMEPSSLCNLECVMCPTSSYESEKGNMSIHTFGNIIPYLNNVEVVDLTGWGEPLTNPDIFVMIEGSKKKGRAVSITTNGTLLDEGKGKKILDSGLDNLYVSADGASSLIYNSIRKGAILDKTLTNLRNLLELKAKSNSDKPYIAVNYIMMKRNIHEIPNFVEVMSQIEVTAIFFKSINGIFKREDIDEVLFEGYYSVEINKRERDYFIEKAKEIAEKKHINLIFLGSFKVEKKNFCQILPLEGPFISWNGDVAPCCVLAYQTPIVLNKKDIKVREKVILGNVNLQTLDEIWQSRKYMAFRLKMKEGIIPEECEDCLGFYNV